jgi:hypothetical protein
MANGPSYSRPVTIPRPVGTGLSVTSAHVAGRGPRTGAVGATIAARAKELDEASSKQRESSDPGHGSYQNDSRSDPRLEAVVAASPELGLDALSVSCQFGVIGVAHQFGI